MSESTVSATVAPESTVPAPAVAPEAPQAAATDAGASTPPQTPAAPLSRRDALSSAMGRARRFATAQNMVAAGTTGATAVGGQSESQPAATTPPVVDATGRAHDPTNGQFTTPPAAATAAPGTEPAAAPPQPGTSANAPAALPQEIRVPIPEGHPLREQGREYIVAASPEQERDIRGLLNSHTRRQEVETARREAQAAREEALRYRAALEASDAWQMQAIDSGVLEEYQNIKEVNPKAAERFLRGAMAEMEEDASTRYQQATEAVQQQQVTQSAVQFVASAYGELSGRLPAELTMLPAYREAFDLARRNYGDYLDRREALGYEVQPSVEEMRPYLEGALVTSPDIVRFLTARQQSQTAQQQADRQAQQATEAARVRAEAEAKVRADLKAEEEARILAAQQPRNPLSGIAGVRSDVNSTSAPVEDPTRGLTGAALMRNRVQSVRARAAQYATK